MFREMRRFKQQLSSEECVEVLKNEPRGVLAVNGDNGYPYAFPIDFVYLDGKLYFHCAQQGHKLDAIEKDSRVSFCVMDKGFRRENEWALNIRSVIAFGRLKRLDDSEKAVEVLRQLGLKYYPTADEVELEIEKFFPKVQMLELTIEHISGKIVNES